MELQIALLAALVGYLVGSISFARVIMKLVAPGEELTGMELDSGSGETMRVETVGGTAISVKLGAKYGGITAILDILKVAVPTLIFRFWHPEAPYHLMTATMGVVGHNWPIYHRFKGGRGLSAVVGGFLAVDWIGTLITAIVGMVLGLVVIRNVFVSYLLGSWLMIPWLWFTTRDVAYVVYAILANGILLLAIIPELRMMRDQKRRGVQGDFAGAMEATPMGRGIKKIATRFGLLRDLR